MTDIDIDIDALAEKIAEHMADGTFARPLLSPRALGELLGVTERKARDLIGGPNPKIPSFKVDRSRRIDPREVDKYLARQREQE